MQRLLKILGFITLWVVVILVITLLASAGRKGRESVCVNNIEISIAKSANSESIVSEEMIYQLLRRAKIKITGEPLNKVPLTLIEQCIGENGFVESVKAYTNLKGTLYIEVEQRNALARILLDGYNCYITSSGFIFQAPASSALYTSVVTGDYKPLFGRDYTGYIDDVRDEQIEKIEHKIEAVEREKYPIYLREKDNAEDRREVRRSYINQAMFESDDEFSKRVTDLRKENQRLRDLYAYRQRVIDRELLALERRQEAYREEQKKVQKKCEDIYNLITFVEMVEDDPFWRAEIMQINLTSGTERGGVRGHKDEMRLSIVSRSGNFVVTLGSIIDREGDSNVEEKLELLHRFYREALPRVGWDRYREINIEYNNQIVCKR